MPPLGRKRSELAGLNTADFHTVGAHGKNRHAVQLAQLVKVVGVAVEDDPADARHRGGPSYLGQGRSAGGLEDDAVGKRGGFCLDELQDLLALLDGIVVGEDDFQIKAQAVGNFLGRGGLFDLVVIVLRDEGKDKVELFHSCFRTDHNAALVTRERDEGNVGGPPDHGSGQESARSHSERFGN